LGDLVHSPVAWVATAYLVAAIPMGVLVARMRGVDLRAAGSGNIGATNAGRVLGTKLGLVVFALDLAKAALPVWLAAQPFALGGAATSAIAAVGLAAVLGHIFPIYLGFRGGKGVACALGVFLAIDPPVAIAAAILYLQTLVLTRVSAIGSLTAVTGITLALFVAERPWQIRALAVAAALVIWIRHTSNVRQLVREARDRKRAAAGSSTP
jgi:glycerol-3-phosphate acyltransferase PlsY